MGAGEVTAFLADLATEGHVAAATQNQAFAALLFLYKEVLGAELDAACAALGLSIAEVRGMSIQDLMPADGNASFNEYMETLLRDGTAVGLMRIVPPAGGQRDSRRLGADYELNTTRPVEQPAG